MASDKHYNPLRRKKVEFSTLAITVKGKSSTISGYKVYVDATKFVLIEASTVAQALMRSGIENPVKVLKAGVEDLKFFQKDQLREMEESYNRFLHKPSTVLPPPKPIPIHHTLPNQ